MRNLALVFTLVAIISAAGCKSAKKKDEVTSTDTAVEDTGVLSSDAGNALGLQTVYFPYDSFVLDAEAKQKLKQNAQILKDKPNAGIQVEGHTDERGGIQYNIALGEKRANAAKKYLVDLGVKADRISTISYGEEKPLAEGQGEDVYSKNRRANFVVTSR